MQDLHNRPRPRGRRAALPRRCGRPAARKGIAASVAVLIIGCLLVARGAAEAQPPAFDPVPGAVALPDVIPVFPLQDVMLFPNVSRPLHIFEPRYRAMVADALEGDGLIGMVLLEPGYEAEYEGRPPIYPIGCAGRITEVEELPDGRYLIVLQGVVKFRVLEENQSRLYRLARVEALPELVDDAELTALAAFRPVLESILAEARDGAAPPAALPDEDLINGIAQYAPLDPRERLRLLEAPGPLARAQALVELLGPPADPAR